MKALVIGVDGGIGRALARGLADRGDHVIATTRRAGASRSEIRLNLASESIATQELPQADVAILCAAMTGLAECRKNPELSQQVNAIAPAVLARRILAQGTRVVFISTNAVYDWQSPLVPATDPPRPSTLYGQQKAYAEAAISELGGNAAILRPTKVLTPELRLFRSWIDALSGGKEVEAFSDMQIAPVTLGDVVGALITLAGSAEAGIFQISGARDISYFDAARHLAGRVGADASQVKACSARALGFPDTEITSYSSLASDRYSRLTGWAPPDPLAALDSVFGAAIEETRQKALQ